MTTNRQLLSVEQALAEVGTEVSAPPSKPVAGSPSPGISLAEFGSLPTEALFLGVASDGLPVLLNLYDPHPGPMLIAADAGSGKTAFLKTVAQSLMQTHEPSDIQFGVITNYPDEWEDMAATAHSMGVYATGLKGTQKFIRSLAAWAHTNKNTHQCVVLLVDDLESVATLEIEAVQDFRWLLLRGPARRVWPLVTLSAPRYGQVLAWLQNFRTRIFGRIAMPRVADALGADKHSGVEQLEARSQFCLRENENWLRFRLPSC